MANENKNGKTLKAVSTISKSVNKKGKIKGKNKKETKYLTRACTHHVYNKKGKLKPKFFNNAKGECICELCGAHFPTKFVEKADVKEMIKPILGLVDQAKTMAVSGGLGEGAVNKFVNVAVLLHEFPKDYTRAVEAISKRDAVKKKKNNNGNNNGGGSSQYGGWSRQ